MKIHYAAFMALEKAKYIDLFEKKDFTEQEYKFVQAVENSSYKDSLCVTKSCHNKFALAWKSKIKLDLCQFIQTPSLRTNGLARVMLFLQLLSPL